MTSTTPSTTSRGQTPPLDQPYPGVPFRAAFMRFWKKGFTFSGRASRSEYWFAYLANACIVFVLYVLLAIGAVVSARSTIAFYQLLLVLTFAYGLAAIIPAIAITIRRLHDANYSGGMYFLSWIPFVGGIILLILTLQQSNPEGARFDLRPMHDTQPGYGQPAPAYFAPSAPFAIAAPQPAPSWVAPAPSPVPVAEDPRAVAWRELFDPTTTGARLAELAASHPEFATQIAAHQNYYPELRAWAQATSQDGVS